MCTFTLEPPHVVDFGFPAVFSFFGVSRLEPSRGVGGFFEPAGASVEADLRPMTERLLLLGLALAGAPSTGGAIEQPDRGGCLYGQQRIRQKNTKQR